MISIEEQDRIGRLVQIGWPEHVEPLTIAQRRLVAQFVDRDRKHFVFRLSQLFNKEARALRRRGRK